MPHFDAKSVALGVVLGVFVVPRVLGAVAGHKGTK